MRVHTRFTDRHGGVSRPPFATFNLALHVGDDPDAVARNRQSLSSRLDALPFVWMEQVHGDTVRIVKKRAPATLAACDAIVTDCPNLVLAVMVADCIPLLLYDEKRGVVAAVHAGRNGVFLDIAGKTVAKMAETFGCDPADIKARLGPSIHACCYEVGPEIARIARKNFPEAYVNGRYLDLPGMTAWQLERAGLSKKQIDRSPRCTCCDGDYFSYRREGTTGRFAGLVWQTER
ncbi:peptidoglycan editing factor PgeF [Hydrogenimonas sp. SS33]|uniref:peptidoglycan editing factor PgeF n=1 Tax=Hydrogenimonas leucolamina TaxID=2954236 RepID=UPI00336BFB80